jgi:CheY-like chemotaxis protein
MKPKKILVVEDAKFTQKIIVDVLKKAGYEVFTATCAADAVRLAREQDPDLVTLDIELTKDSPGDSWDGFTVAGWLRRMNEDKRKPCVVVLSGNRDPAKLIEKAASVGVHTCLTKPVEKQKLLDAVAEALR